MHMDTEELRNQGKGKNWRGTTSISNQPKDSREEISASRAALITRVVRGQQGRFLLPLFFSRGLLIYS